jgi:hypothetical protein
MATIGSRAAFVLLALMAVAVAAPGCAAIEGIFKAGVWVGVIGVVVVVGIVMVIVRAISG